MMQVGVLRSLHGGLIVLLIGIQAHAEEQAVDQIPAESTAVVGVPVAAPVNALEQDQTTFIEAQINSGEADSALAAVDAMISQIEALHHRYHVDLVTPLKLKGDALMELDQPHEAIESFSRARHIARTNYGLFDRRQIDVVHREADALRAVGDLATAAKREEYAYEVARRDFEEYDPDLLPSINRLAGFYLETQNPLAARTLYNRAYLIHEHSGTDHDPSAVPVLLGIAQTHRLERFPARYVTTSNSNHLEGPQAGLTNSDLDTQYLGINSFPAGERALQIVVEIQRRTFGENSPQEIEAILDLADWHLLFQRSHTAHTLYTHIYEKLAELGHDPATLFGHPRLLYYPRPEDLKRPPADVRGERKTGVVQLSFGVSPSGRVRNLKTVGVVGNNTMLFRTRRSMRVAVFRPKFENGSVVVAQDQVFNYEFPYWTRSDRARDEKADELNGEATAVQVHFADGTRRAPRVAAIQVSPDGTESPLEDSR